MSKNKKRMIKEITDYINKKLSSEPAPKKRITFHKESQVHDDTKKQKSKRERRQSKKDIRNEDW